LVKKAFVLSKPRIPTQMKQELHIMSVGRDGWPASDGGREREGGTEGERQTEAEANRIRRSV